jgi:hypothetical protein
MCAQFSDSNFWAAISAIGGAVSAIAALCTIWQSRKSGREAREAQRPYFLLEAPGIKNLPESPPFRLQLTLRNAGGHPATCLDGRIYVVPAAPGAMPTIDSSFSVANDVPPNSPTPWYTDSVMLPQQCPPHFALLGIEYLDPLLNKRYSQAFFMRWDGVQNGTTQPDFVHVSKAEKVQLEKQFSSIVGPYQRGG